MVHLTAMSAVCPASHVLALFAMHSARPVALGVGDQLGGAQVVVAAVAIDALDVLGIFRADRGDRVTLDMAGIILTAAGLGFLIEGRLQTVDFTLDGREVGIDFVDERDFFGELAVIDHQPAPEYVIAVAPSRVAMLDRERARELMFSTPETSASVALRLAQRMRRSARQRAVLALPSSFQRVCAQLLLMTQQPSGGPVTIQLAPTHQEIAIMVNTSRETVTRTLQFLQTLKVVARAGQSLVVNQPQTLQEAADGKLVPRK